MSGFVCVCGGLLHMSLMIFLCVRWSGCMYVLFEICVPQMGSVYMRCG